MNCQECKDNYDKLLPGYDAPVVVGEGCGHCKDHCHKCACPEPIQEVEQPYSAIPGMLRWNYGGRSVEYDLTNLVRMTQTDTSVSVNKQDRTLVHTAERHTDEIAASELGAILNVADIGDVEFDNVEDGSLLIYQKNSNCSNGCIGLDNKWVGWNAYDEDSIASSVHTVMGFTDKGTAKTILSPLHPNQYYNLGWNASGKIGYSQPVEKSTAPVDSSNYAYRLYLDPTTKQVVYVKESV